MSIGLSSRPGHFPADVVQTHTGRNTNKVSLQLFMYIVYTCMYNVHVHVHMYSHVHVQYTADCVYIVHVRKVLFWWSLSQFVYNFFMGRHFTKDNDAKFIKGTF